MGHSVYCVNILSEKKIIRFFSKYINKIFRMIFGRDTLFLFHLFPVLKKRNNKIIKKAIDKFGNCDVLLFFSYSLSGCEVTNIPSILFCDFTIEYAIHNLHKRKVKWYEKTLITHQDKIIRSANLVVSLFPKATEHYRKYYKTNNIYGVQGHILNCDEKVEKVDELIKTKLTSKKILFIGRKSYKQGALCLYESINLYNKTHFENPISLSIIGMNESDLGIQSNEFVKCLGVLDKNKKEEKIQYYELIRTAKCIVNTTKNWGGISSITEAMYFGTPVITTSYDEFVEIFGEKIDFGYYSEPENVEQLKNYIEKLMSMDDLDYRKMCNCSHNAVKDFTWYNCVKGILECFENQKAPQKNE